MRPAPTPSDIRWWVGVVWLLLSALLLGFVTHVTIIGSLQHSRAQYVLYQNLRTELALATTPLGQLDVDGNLVPNGVPLGLISIDRLGITEVYVQGTTPADLTKGPGHRRDTVMPGQEGTSIIMGRQATYGGPFGSLSALLPGDQIMVTTGQGTATYSVFGIRRDGDLLPQPLQSGEGRLELITANGVPLAPSGSLHIDASLESKTNETPSPVFTKEVLDPSELDLGTDSTGWFPLLFWLQWLTVAVTALRWVRSRWGMWQTWMIAVPVVLALGAATADAAMTILPNLL
jgi:sortase A